MILRPIQNGLQPLINFEIPQNKEEVFKYLFRILFVLSIYIVVSKFIQIVGYQPIEVYYGSTLLGGFFKQLFTLRFGAPILLLGAFLIFYRKRLLVKWTDFERGNDLKLFSFLIASLLIWKYSFYHFNLFFGQAHYFDRIVLVFLGLLILLRPIFLLPFLLVLRIIIHQFESLPIYSEAEFSLPFAVLTLLLSFYIFYLLSGKFILRDFVCLLICVFGSHYVPSGLGKFNWAWIADDRLAYLLSSSYASDWLKFLSQEEINSFMSIMDYINLPLKILVLLLELGSVFIFANKRLVRFFLVGWILMHIGVFLNTGICFWVWSLSELILLYFLSRKNNLLSNIKFTRLDIIVGIVLILGGSFWTQIVKLAWYDTPLAYVYRYEATNQDGDTFQLPNHIFAPYDYQFTINSLSYLCDWPLLNTGSSQEIMQKLKTIDSKSEFLNYETEKGIIQYNSKKVTKLQNFVSQYFKNWNIRQSSNIIFSPLESPRLLWTFPLYYNSEEIGIIKSVKVVHEAVFYYKGNNEKVREKVILEIPIH